MAEIIFGPCLPNPLFHPISQRRHSAQGQPQMNRPLFQMYVNGIYYPNWHVYKNRPPSSLNLDCISHVFYAFAWVKPDGTVYLSDETADSQIEVDGVQGALRACSALRRQPSGIPRVLLSIGGGGKGSESFAIAASKAESRHRFSRTARQLVLEYGIDGIDIDWEHPSTPEEGADYVQLLATLRSYLPMPRFWLTSALPAGEWALKNINISQAAQYLNFINIMAYDFSGPWSKVCGHQAQLSTPARPHDDAAAISCQSATAYFVSKGVHPKQLVLGVPTYGRSFLNTRGVGHSYSGHGGEDGTFEYKDLPRPGTQEQVDETVGAAYCIGADGELVSYDNPATVRMKAQFVKQNDLQGLFYWTGTSDAQGPRSLVCTGFEELHSGR